MSTSTAAPSAATPANPSPLPTRYSIRQLTAADVQAAQAIWVHALYFHTPLVTTLYKGDMARFWRMYDAADYLVRAPIGTGLCYGVFDVNYTYKRAESAATGGALYWDDRGKHTDGRTLLAGMDFPLVSIADSYDQFAPIDFSQLQPLVEAIPVFADVFRALSTHDKRAPDWRATTAGQVLVRCGTSTRHDYEGQDIMKSTAHWLMREAALRGYRGVQIECVHDAVSHVWLHPSAPFTAEVVSSVDCATYSEEGRDGVAVQPFTPATTVIKAVYVTLQ